VFSALLPPSDPPAQDHLQGRIVVDQLAVDETVNRRELVRRERGQQRFDDSQPTGAGQRWSVRRQIIDSDGYLNRVGP
jgi:hypothetical protein